MAEFSAEVNARLSAGLRKYQPIIEKARDAGKNESDTVTIITDILSDVFGYDKYEEITSELAIKRQFCDLAIVLDKQVRLLIECKAASIELREEHVIQANNYAANAGIDWVILTHGVRWMLYRVIFEKPVQHIMVYDFDFLKIDPGKAEDRALIYGLCREAFTPKGNDLLEKMFSQRGTVNRYIIGQVLLNDWMIGTVRRSVQRHFPSVQLTDAELRRILKEEIFREDISEGESAVEAAQIVSAANARMRAAQREENQKKSFLKNQEGKQEF